MTAWFQGRSGLKNGALLKAEEEAGFDLFVAVDQELSYQQNLADRGSLHLFAFAEAAAPVVLHKGAALCATC